MFSLTACLAFLENEKDEEAFLRYYERYHRLVLYEAEKIVGPSAAEDVMQNTFVYIAKHFSTFRSGSSKKVTHLAALCARRRALDYPVRHIINIKMVSVRSMRRHMTGLSHFI